MKACYFWVRGPFQEREVVLQKVKKVQIGPAGEGRLEVPGCPAADVWGVVVLEKARCYLTNAGAPVEIQITRKERGQLTTIAVPTGKTVETKGNDVISFGPEGPAAYCQYELEPGDMFGGSLAELPEAVSPLSAERRRELVEAHSVAKKQDLAEVRKEAEAAVGQVGGELKAEKQRARGRFVILGVGVAVAVIAALGTFVALRRSELATEDRLKMLASALGGGQKDFDKNVELLKSAREEAAKELERLTAEHDKMKKTVEADDGRLAALREQMEAYELELEKNRPLEEKFASMQKTIDGSLFLVACYMRVSNRIFQDPAGNPSDWGMATGTAFVVDRDGTMVTCKHVVEPWKFAEFAQMLALYRTSVVECRLEAFPVGHEFSGGGSLGKGYSTEEGKLELVATAPDEMQEYAGTVNGVQVAFRSETNFENDLAILKVKAPRLKPLKMATDREFEILRQKKIWPVMVAGFPLGLQALEGGKVVSSMTLGNVRKVEKFVQHSAPTCGGNSGGPVIDASGRVVGVVSFAPGGEKVQNLNMAVPITLARRLIDGAKARARGEGDE